MMKQNNLGKYFKFTDSESQHINREAWDERQYSYNSWDDRNWLKNVCWNRFYLENFKQKKGGFMFGIALIISILALYWWSAT